ncbi:MAG: hypothetical protein ACR2Q3_11735 [Woeseiaceae bacterium]
MKKILFISMLFLFQTACTTQTSQPAEPAAMLNFVDLAAEISVEHEVTESTAALDDDDPGHTSD